MSWLAFLHHAGSVFPYSLQFFLQMKEFGPRELFD